MNGITMKGNIVKGKTPKKLMVKTVNSAKNLPGQTGSVSSSKKSVTAGFSASTKSGSIKGSCGY